VAAYPPEPWQLRGQLYLSLWSVPADRLPALPPPVAVAGRALVGTAWVRYEPGSVLEYQELLAAVLVRDGWRPRVTITGIWVDSPASRDGGRALWGIPKELATLHVEPAGTGVTASAYGTGPIARATVDLGTRLPVRWPVRFSVIQTLAGALKTSPVRARGTVQWGRSRWEVDAGGPLGHLSGGRPLLTVALRDFEMLFGTARR
jgi:hypothetical protein